MGKGIRQFFAKTQVGFTHSGQKERGSVILMNFHYLFGLFLARR